MWKRIFFTNIINRYFIIFLKIHLAEQSEY